MLYGFSSAAGLKQLESFLRRCKRTGYCNPDMLTVTEETNGSNDSVFRYQQLVLQYLLAYNPDLVYNLRPRSITKLLYLRLQNLIIVIFCECYIVTATSIQLFIHRFIMLGCVLSTVFGPQFVKRFAVYYRTVVCLSCLVLYVCL